MIEVQKLTKSFGAKVAVDKVSFQVKKGEVLGFLGPNGAGKSTTMRMITGFFPPTKGDILIDGKSIFEDELTAKAKIGYLPESAPLYHDMTVADFLNFAAEMRGIEQDKKAAAVDRVVELCFLQPVRYQSIDTLSKGYRHRTCLAQALIHDPDILILDEPTDGLDPNQKHEIRGLIREMGKEKAIIFSTHILEEVDAACTRAIIISEGQIIEEGTPAELKAKADSAGGVSLKARGEDAPQLAEAIKGLSEAEAVTQLNSDGDAVSLLVKPTSKGRVDNALSREIYKLCTSKKVAIEELAIERGQLDEVFRKLTISDTTSKSKSKS